MSLNNDFSQVTEREFQTYKSGMRATDYTASTHINSTHYSRKVQRFGQFSMLLGVSTILALVALELTMMGMLVAALMCGMAESRGRCGISHIGMIAPWKSIDSRAWIKCCLSYSVSGLVTAYLIGLIVASLGSWINLGSTRYYFGFVGVLCICFFLRDLGWIKFRSPQCDQQTYKEWISKFGFVTGVGMWGAHIGLAVSTVVTFSGLYCLILFAFGVGLGGGEWLLVAFWLGRVVFLWTTPWLMNSTSNGMEIGLVLERSHSMFRLCSLCGIACMCVLIASTLYLGVW